MSRPTSANRRFFRKTLIMPAEHGSWAWLLVPFGVGAGVAGRFNGPVLLTLLAGLSVFLMRQPATVWLRARRGRGRRRDGPLAAAWTLLLGVIALLCLWGLPAWGRTMMLWLALPLLLIFALYLLASRHGRAGLRSLGMEVAGAAALAMMAPAAHIAAVGEMTAVAWALWFLLGLQNVLGALYVRVRIADTHGRPAHRGRTAWAHAAGLGAVLLASWGWTAVPWGTAVPFLGYLLRALWTARRPRPVPNVKRFGFTELGVEIVSGLILIAAYHL